MHKARAKVQSAVCAAEEAEVAVQSFCALNISSQTQLFFCFSRREQEESKFKVSNLEGKMYLSTAINGMRNFQQYFTRKSHT